MRVVHCQPEHLVTADVDAMTPLEALKTLAELKKKIEHPNERRKEQ